MRIAITSYVDLFYEPHYEQHYANEANAMTYSGSDLDERFEFVIFCHPAVSHLIQRRNNVRVIPYNLQVDDYYKSYPYAKSLKFINDCRGLLSTYDYIIKTDTDVFFTSTLNDFNFDETITTGKQTYIYPYRLNAELEKVANHFGYQPTISGDMFSTVIGPAKDIINIFGKADYLCRRIYSYFDDDGIWMETLFRGVSSMYATEIVISSEYKDRINISDKFDAHSDIIDPNDHRPWTYFHHIHQYHTDQMFSKFKARDGEYDNLPIPEVKDLPTYCLKNYLEAKR